MDITHNLKIKASAKSIYNAVATKEGISGWWSKDCKVGEKAGDESELKFDKQGTTVVMGFKTISLDDNKKVVWECTQNANPSWLGTRIITEIEENGNDSKVKFSHANFDEKWAGQDPFEMTKQGWEHFVSSLKSYCETGKGQPW